MKTKNWFSVFIVIFAFCNVSYGQGDEIADAGKPNPSKWYDNFSVGAGVVYYTDTRIIEAEINSADYVEVNKDANTSAQLMLDFHVFGKKNPDTDFISAKGWFVSLLTGYGIDSENTVLDGAGIGYVISVFDVFNPHNTLNVGFGVMYINSVTVLKNGVEDRKPLPSGVTTPTKERSMAVPVLSLSIGL